MRSLPSLTALRVFEVAAKKLSFTEAAKQLHVTQGAVSRQIKQLEDYLGVPMFIRYHHKLALTDAGEQLLFKLDQSFNIMESAIAEIRNPKQRQKLNLLLPPTMATRWLAGRLSHFRKLYPELEIAIHDHYNNQILFDCEIRFGRTPKPKYFSELLFLEHHIPVCLPEMIDKACCLKNESHNLLHILHEGKKLPVWDDWLEAANLKDQVNAKHGVEFSTLDQVISALKTGAGFAVIDKHMIEYELSESKLKQFNDTEVIGPYGYWLDIPADKQGLSKVIHFTNWLRVQVI